MSRPLRLEFADALYHVSSRGNAGQAIFQRDGDRRTFLEFLESEVEQQRWICYGYCLLEKDYQLLVETPEPNLGRGMARLNAIYSQWFNRCYNREGHLFRGRYKAILVEKEAFLLALCRDLAYAPVRAGLAKRPSQWPWSSHRTIARGRGAPTWLASGWVLGQFEGDGKDARNAYGAYVAEGKDARSPWEKVRGQIYLGRDPFLKQMARRVEGLSTEQISWEVLHPDRPTREQIVHAVAKAAGVPTDAVFDRRARPDVFQTTVYLLRRAGNLTLKDTAALGGVSPPRISQIQRAIEDAGGLSRAFGWAGPLSHLLA